MTGWPATKTCPKCQGKGRRLNLILPGSHQCGRCQGGGWVTTRTYLLYARIRYGLADTLED